MLFWILFAAVLSLALLFPHPHFFQDVQYVLSKLKVRRRVQKYHHRKYSIVDRFLDRVKAQPHKPFILFKDETFTYRDADELSNKAARVFLQSGLVKEGDTVALFLGNSPMFLWLWLGLVKIGCSAAFLNHNIRSRSLLHCFNCSGATTLVAGEELQDAVEEVLPSLLEQQVTVFILADRCRTADVKSFSDKMSQASSEPISKDLRSHLTLQSPAAYIYTSGTTGLPKAAVISHSKLWTMSLLLSTVAVNSKDVIYISLPLYHSAGFIGFTTAIERGITVAMRSKFSASQFWDDCRKYNVTVIQYIGEIMRYLCNTPRKLNDRSHKVRLAVGNGIRADVWRDFTSRFGNIQIREFYGATEGNFFLLNYTGKIGAVGRDTFLHKRFFPYSLIKYDVDKGSPLRDSAGFCIEAAKGLEGRAGMAAVTLSEGQKFDSAGVFKHVEKFLPSYARPRFMRIRSSLDVTGTFKYLKTKLVEDGFNPNHITDPLYFLDEKDKNYIPLTLDIFSSITTGKIKI
uniref:very long-chain acyl-CoA synthetase-like isoform X2 n=1 Tax=Scatophagus argus TaxID=75038 RepID=UPI001ED83F28|nr:very long-chain acyl-CoA synthetase-like isoform X2 [Scatophagus argus]